MHPALQQTDHRPWPTPSRRWSWRQSWCDLLFAHWPLPASVLRPHVPSPLELSERDGSAWIGIVPFRMSGVMRRPLPDLPWISDFPEINLRTYVDYEGRPGVWFFSLDATNPLAVWGARRFFHLPYFRADIDVALDGDGTVAYDSRRRDGGPHFRATYRPLGSPYQAASGTLEHWLTERYCLYAVAADGGLSRTEVQHAPWPLQRAEVEIAENTMTTPLGVTLDEPPALVHFARRIDVVAWSPDRLVRDRGAG